jgi:uncharacterized protein (TIGR03435 family)
MGRDWVKRTAFAVEAVALAEATPRQRRLMLQTLLEDRFALKIRRETGTGDYYAMVIALPAGTLGPKVKAWDGTCRTGTRAAEDEATTPRCLSGYRAGGISLDGVTMFNVADFLSLPQSRMLLGRVTHDHTGLNGRYTMGLDYQFAPPRAADPAAPPDFAGPSLFTAVQEQWGLRLVPDKGPFTALVVESAEPPTAN